MAINFPSTPSSGDLHTDGDLVWKYNGSAWDSFYGPSTAAQFGLGNVDNTSDADKPVSTAQQAAISAISKSSLGLGNVDNTSDEDKPVSTAQQAALDALTKDDVGLDNVDNTSDMNKPVSTAQQAAIDAAGGGSSFDQDLNTTDSPTFATLTTTDTIATDVYAVDVSASGTVTAGEVTTDTFRVASGGYAFKSGSTQIASFYPGAANIRGSVVPGINGIYDLGANGSRWDDLWVERVDATGTVKKGVFTVATLPTGEAGMTCFVSDANATTRGSTVAGGGANFMPVYSDGTNWIIY